MTLAAAGEAAPSGSSKKLWLALFAATTIWTLLQIPLGLDDVRLARGYETMTVARNLAVSGQFRDPYALPTGLTAHVPPVYASMIALLYRVFGMNSVPATLLLIAMNACLLGAAAAFLPLLSVSVYGTRGPGIAGAILLACSSRLMPQHDAALAALLLILAAMAILKSAPLIAGVWSGVTILANPVSLAALVIMAARRNKRFAATVTAVALVICTPWIVRNWVAVGAPYFIRDNLGLELYVSNNDRAEAELVANAGSLMEMHPTQLVQEARLVSKLGEGAYNRLRLADAAKWVLRHPARFVQLSGERAFHYWLPSSIEGWQAHLYFFLVPVAAIGAWVGRTNRTAVTLGMCAVVYSLPFVFIQTDIRYSFPMFWVPATLAGYAVWELAARRAWPNMRRDAKSRQRVRQELRAARRKR